MRVLILNPHPRGQRGGNRTTALRWARILRRLGARVRVEQRWSGQPADLLVALNGWRSGESILRFRAAHPELPIVVAITGTDLYTGEPDPAALARAFAASTRLVVLQELALEALAPPYRAKAVVIHQSVRPLPDPPAPRDDAFECCVVANLRPVKDPLLAARAARRLPARSRIRIVGIGETLDAALGAELARERAANPRFLWLGALPRLATLRRIAAARLLVSTSRAEGGAGVVSEALAHGVPVLATDVPGARGMLPAGYPGLFPVGDEGTLARLLARAEEDASFLAALAALCRSRAWITAPAREEAAWGALLAEIGPGG
ncbi:MAG: selenoneine biosynthesis selenosugar synthase SenB [Planctomycetota bacterium]